MSEQPRLDVFRRQRFLQQRIVEEVYLADGEVIGGPPPGVDGGKLVAVQRALDIVEHVGRWGAGFASAPALVVPRGVPAHTR